MSVGWAGADGETEMSFGTIPAYQDDAVFAAVWAASGEPCSVLSRQTPDYLAWRLPKDDPIRMFRQLGESGQLAPGAAAQLAARLADIALALEESYRLNSRSIQLWIESEERQLFDRCAHAVHWLLRECALAAAKNKEIRWG
ncbi:MAG: hypothetical protein ACK526_08110 [Planctomyces sp.]